MSTRIFSQQPADSILIAELLKSDYKTLEKFDVQKHLAHCTSDYILIEDGEIWNLQKEIQYFKSNAHRVITRKDFFTIHQVRVTGNAAYMVYQLKSDITENNKVSTKYWSESAVFRKLQGKWKIALIHSTTVEKKI